MNIIRIRFDMWRRARIESIRQRLLQSVPRSWLYYLTIQAGVRVLRSDEHPDSLGLLDAARRLERRNG